MELAKIEVTRADARKVHCNTLTAGMKGAEVSFSFDASWDGLKRLATFKAGGVSKDMLLTEDRCEIPHEVLAKPCPRLVVGIVGTTADGCLVIPTVWAELGRVEQGAKPSGDSSKKPTPEVWAQILGMIGDLDDLNTDEKETLVAAINEVLLKGADPEEIQKIVEEYLGENGSGSIHVGPYPPDDPNVDIWIDTSEKLTPPYIPNTTMAKPDQIVRVVTVDGNGAITAVEAVDMPSVGEYALPLATAETLGGVKAEPATEDDTQPVRIGEDGMLFTAPGGGGGDVWELIADITFEEQVNSFSIDVDQKGNPFSLKKYLLAYVWEKITDGEQSATYMFVIENNRQYGDNQPPLYTSALEVAQVNSLVGGMIYNELLPNHIQWGQAWRNTVQSSISVEPFRPIGSPQTNVMGKTVFKQHNDYLPFYQIGGKGAVMPKDSRVMLWGVRA